jgi:hypothetical protein
MSRTESGEQKVERREQGAENRGLREESTGQRAQGTVEIDHLELSVSNKVHLSADLAY